ncbi:glycosyltransferase family 2 protein [Tessaracoccus sp. Y1736]
MIVDDPSSSSQARETTSPEAETSAGDRPEEPGMDRRIDQCARREEYGEIGRFSVIIVAYYGADLVQACIESVLQYSPARDLLEIVVVDNSPRDEVITALGVKFLDTKPVVRFVSNENRGFGHGNNVGASVSASEYLLFLNPDTELVEPVLDFASHAFDQDPRLGCFGMQLVDRDGGKLMSFFWIDANGFAANLLIRIANRYGLFAANRMFTSGANLFVRRCVFMEVGGFDENIFMYNEEPDLFRRISGRGLATKFFHERRIVHLEGGGESGESLTRLIWRLESRKYYSLKHNASYSRYLVSELRRHQLRRLVNRLRGVSRPTEEEPRITRLKLEVQIAKLHRGRSTQ